MGNTTLGTIYMIPSISPQLSGYGTECADGDSCSHSYQKPYYDCKVEIKL